MQDVDLFLSLAEIAGVFVGFGALIATRSGGMETREVSDLRWVMSSAIWVVVAALAPIFVSRYGVTGHALWLTCSLLALVLLAIMVVVNGWAPESREEAAVTFATTSPGEVLVVAGLTFWVPLACLVLVLAIVAVGSFPDREQPLYLTAVALGLLMSALGLFVAVFWQRRPSRS